MVLRPRYMVLTSLATDADASVRRAVASNQSTTEDILIALALDSDATYSSSVYERVLAHPNLTAAVLAAMAGNPIVDARVAVAGHELTGTDTFLHWPLTRMPMFDGLSGETQTRHPPL